MEFIRLKLPGREAGTGTLRKGCSHILASWDRCMANANRWVANITSCVPLNEENWYKIDTMGVELME
jgi:hypothetical protein